MNPRYYLANAMMGNVHTLARQYDEALACYAIAREADSDSKFIDSLQAMTLANAERKAEAVALLQKITQRAASDYISPVSIAYVHTALGDTDQAFENLDRAIEDRDPNLLGLKSNPIFDPLRNDPRYHALLKKMQLD
jgi:tetratricopeptide (TPR) repeat protein